MIHLPKDKSEVLKAIAGLKATALSRDDVLQIILTLDCMSQAVGPEPVQNTFPELYQAGLDHFGDWLRAIRCSGVRLNAHSWYGIHSYEVIHTEQEYREYFTPFLNQIMKTRKNMLPWKRPTLLLPAFREDVPIIMTSCNETKKWLNTIRSLFPDLFRHCGLDSSWSNLDTAMPFYSIKGSRIRESGMPIRIMVYENQNVNILFWLPPKGKV